jgi:hypothetical protein
MASVIITNYNVWIPFNTVDSAYEWALKFINRHLPEPAKIPVLTLSTLNDIIEPNQPPIPIATSGLIKILIQLGHQPPEGNALLEWSKMCPDAALSYEWSKNEGPPIPYDDSSEFFAFSKLGGTLGCFIV